MAPMKVTTELALPSNHIKNGFPNICQADDNISVLRNNPKTHCGPVAVANIVVYLTKNGHQMLVEPQGGLLENEALNRLIEKLASCMQTGSISDADPGTTPQNLIDGLEKYVVERGYRLPTKVWKGWGAGEVLASSEAPEMILIAEGTYGDKNSLLHLGWYLDEKTGTYKRYSGHFANNVGYTNLNTDSNLGLIVHDPSPRSKAIAKFCEPEIIDSGQLDNKGKIETAKDYSFLHGIDINTAKGANAAIVDGAFIFEVAR